MPLPTSPAEVASLGDLDGSQPFFWFFEIKIPTTPTSMLRIVRNTHPVQFGQTSTGVDITYDPVRFDIGSAGRRGQGAIPSVIVGVSNVSRDVQAAIENHNGLIGQFARLFVVPRATLPSGKILWEIEGEVVTTESDEQTVSVEVGLFNLYRRNFPAQRAGRDTCRHLYGGAACGYDTTRTTPTVALQTCTKLRKGTDGCEDHGADEEAAGLTSRHPRRFGGFPGMIRRSGIL